MRFDCGAAEPDSFEHLRRQHYTEKGTNAYQSGLPASHDAEC